MLIRDDWGEVYSVDHAYTGNISWYVAPPDDAHIIKEGMWPPPFKNRPGKKRGLYAAVNEASEKVKAEKKKAVEQTPAAVRKLNAGPPAKHDSAIVDEIMQGDDGTMLKQFLEM